MPPDPVIVPAYVVVVPSPPRVNVPAPSATLALALVETSDPIVWLELSRLNIPLPMSVCWELADNWFAPFGWSVALLMVVAPE